MFRKLLSLWHRDSSRPSSLSERIGRVVGTPEKKRLPSNLGDLDESYGVMIRELSKR